MQSRSSFHRSAFLAVLATALLLVAANGAFAQPEDQSEGFRWNEGAALGVSVFSGPVSAEPYQPITGYDGGTLYTATRGRTVEATDEGLVVRRNGTYRVHLEGVLFADADDPTADPDAAAAFHIFLDGEQWVFCMTPSLAATSLLPADFQPTPDHEKAPRCTVDFTFQVKGKGNGFESEPFVFPRGTTIQAVLEPNDRALGDATLALARIEVTRVAP